MNNADILAMLGGAGIPGAGSSRREEEGKTILTFKAGKMDPVLQPNGKYLITADRRRGQVSLLYTLSTPTRTGNLKLEWKDRRTQSVESIPIIPEDGGTFAPIPTGREGERVYVLQFGSNTERRFFYWMQDKLDPNVDDQHCIDMNKYISDVNACIVAAGGEPPVPEESTSTNDGAPEASSETPTATGTPTTATSTTTTTTAPASSSTEQQQVDALSNILENLGMPQRSTTTTTTSSTHPPAASASTTSAPSTTPSANTSTTTGGVLTLADLQGAMAGLATHSPSTSTNIANPTPPLTELANSDAIHESGILDNPTAVARLMEFLPEHQRTEEMLRENLRSPQVQQALHSLTMALVGQDDDQGSLESYHSIIANFQLTAEDGAAAMASGNPIQAFLDCLLASVTKENESTEEGKE